VSPRSRHFETPERVTGSGLGNHAGLALAIASRTFQEYASDKLPSLSGDRSHTRSHEVRA
jgi:hypothetical protein